jgi:hypothetical protein
VSSFIEYIADVNRDGQRRARARLAAGAVARKAPQARIAAPAASPRASRRPEPRPSRRAERADFSHLDGLSLAGFSSGAIESAEPFDRFLIAARDGTRPASGSPAIQRGWAAAFAKAGIDFAPSPRRTATLRAPTGRLIPASNWR